MSDNSELIDTLLTCQSRAIRWQVALALGLFLVGLLLFTIGVVAKQFDDSPSKIALSFLGFCSSTASAFPIKDLIVRREKADALRLLRVRLKTLETESDHAEAEKITTMLWESLQAIIER